MADLKISQLGNAAALDGTEEVEVVQSGVNVKTTTQDIADLGGGGGAVASVNGQTGVVALDAGDIPNTPAGGIAATDVQAALNELDTEKQAALVSGTNIKTVNGTTILGSGDIDLIDDAIVNGETKAPSQNAVFDALALKADLASPTFTGTPAAPTASSGTSTTQLATTAFVQGEIAFSIVSITTGATLDSTAFGKMHICTGTTSNYTLVLPTAVGNANKSIAFKGSSALTKNVTIDGNSGETIDGEQTREFNANGLYVIISDGSNWHLVAEVGSWCNYTPVWTGFSADPTVSVAKYFRQGKLCTVKVQCSANGTSNATTTTVTAPVNAASVVTVGLVQTVANNGTVAATPGQIVTRANSNIFDLYRDGQSTAWTSSGGKRASFTYVYETE